MKEFKITYKGKTYELDKDYWKGTSVNNSIDFQYMQLKYCEETQDYTTLENRITNMLIWGGIKEIKTDGIV